MCGRTCLTLAPDEICTACGKLGSDGKRQKLNWRNEYNLGRKYEGHVDGKGYNTAPQDITPVLVSSTNFEESDSSSTIIVPMLWGLIPRWHKGDYKKHGLTTNNCRLEGLRESKLYQPLLKAGNRCVVLCEGFYEWQTVTGAKASDRKVYYIYFPQQKGVRMEDKSTWQASDVKLFKVAGLYDKWTNEVGDTMYSYTIITFESNEKLSWLHHRTPAVLETDQQVDDWLDVKRVPAEESFKLLTQPKEMIWHQVSNYVNSSRNKSEQCNKPLSETKAPKSKMMQMWLLKTPKVEPKVEEVKAEKRSCESEDGNDCTKKSKND